MKKVLIATFLIFATFFANAQSWNPYVNQGIISQLLPEEFGGLGEASFNIGNTGSSSLYYDHSNPDPMVLTITLSNGVPDKNNPLASLKGSWVSMFNWTYDASTSAYTGIQKRTIPGYDQGTISIGYRVINNSVITSATNGFHVHIQAPSYASTSNTTQDDIVSSYTFTGAFDYGDAPQSYGAAQHTIDVTKDPVSGLYTKYIVLGSFVDQESESKPSSNADGDDISDSDDEDGVYFPELKAGTDVTIPVTVTCFGTSFGILNTWFDWNGDGDFTDADEKVSGIPIFTSGTYNLSVSIPETAITDQPTFARFRIGNNSDAISANSWGEVEDYRIMIQGEGSQVTTPIATTGLLLWGKRDGSDIHLNWETQTENNTTYFRVERSIDGADFEVIGENIEAAGYSEILSTYSYTDFEATEELVTYRVRLFELDNNELVSNAIIIQEMNSMEIVDILEGINISVYPNPITDKFFVTIDSQGHYQLDLLDFLGRVISSKTLSVSAVDIGITEFSRGNLSMGSYFLRITDTKTGAFETVKLLVLE
ncbi:MAG: T9SS type A sorting domain-containing protein [Bacteroidota bacterium]